MSDPATATFLGVLVAVILAIKYWRVVLLVLTALIVTVLLLGAREVAGMADRPGSDPAVNGTVNSPAEQEQEQIDQSRLGGGR